MTLQQFIAAGGFSLFVGLITAFIVKAQATKVADTTAKAQVGVKKLENDGAAMNLWHDDLKAARDELRDERAAHFETLRLSANLSAENKRLVDCNSDLESENSVLKETMALIRHENDNLKTAKQGWDWFQTRPDILRKMADDLERKNGNP